MDPRAAHTLEALHRTILELAANRSLDDISITEIASHAGVNRSSFYQHFSDREALLASALEHSETEAARPADPRSASDPERALVHFLEHFAAHADVYRRALGPRGSARVASRVRARTLTLIQEAIEERAIARRSALPPDVEAAGAAGALLGIIETWLARDPMPEPAVAAGWMLGLFAQV